MGIKDKVISAGIEKIINHYFEDLGEVEELSIDSTHKTILLNVRLKGEAEPVKLFIKEYEITGERNKYYFILNGMSASREWINILFNKYLKGTKIEIPSKYESIIRHTL